MLCVNASNIDADREWLVELNGGRANFEDVSDATALIAVQGPVAVAILATLADFPIADVARFGVASGQVAGITCLAARTGYTGEDGFELFVDNAGARQLFEAILDAGAARRCQAGRTRRARHAAARSGAAALRSRTRSQFVAARGGPGDVREAGASVHRRELRLPRNANRDSRKH